MRVRELLATFGFDFDDRGLRRADRSIKGLFNQLTNLRNVLVGGAIAIGFQRIVGLASDANETMNVLGEVFQDNAQTVTQWASDLAGPIGRSEFMLRDFAAQLGAVIQPMVGSRDAAADMSTNLAQLAVDLGSFFNTTDEDALNALRSGLVGSTEPLRRFGIVLTEAQLNAFAMEKGLGKTTKQMSEAEKTTLRYQFIMAKTANAQGDAIKTAEGFANASKALKAQVIDLGTRIGLVLLPPINAMVGFVGGALTKFNELIKGTNLLKNALTVLGVVAGLVGIKMLIPWIPAIATAALFGAALAAIILIYDDFVTAIEGGDSVLGRMIGNWDKWVEQVAASHPILGFLMFLLDGIGKGIAALAGVFTGEWGVVVEAIKEFGEALAFAADWWNKLIVQGFDKFISLLVGSDLKPLATIDKLLQKSDALIGQGLSAAGDAIGSFFSGGGPPAIPAGGEGPRGAAGNSVAQNNRVDVTVNAAPGMNEERLAGEVEKSIKNALNRQNRQAANALLPAGG